MMRIVKKYASWKHRHYVTACVFALCAVSLALILVTFHQYDRSWAYSNNTDAVRGNIAGSVGANLAALCFYLFGFAAWVLVFFLGYGAYAYYKSLELRDEWDRVVGYFLLLLTASALLFRHSIKIYASLFPGGVVGAGMYRMVTYRLDTLGATLLLYVLLFIAVIMVCRVSFMQVVHGCVYLIRLLTSAERFWKPAYNVSYAVVHAVARPFVWTAHFLKKLFGGVDLEESGKSIISFEEQLLHDVEEHDEVVDSFWQSFVHEQPNETSMPLVLEPATELRDEQRDMENGQKQQQPYRLPELTLFAQAHESEVSDKTAAELKKRARILEEKLEHFGVVGSVVSIKTGPVVTLFEYQPHIDSKLSKIVALEDDLALALRALSIRIIAPIPGKAVVGFEVANETRQNVALSSIIHSNAFTQCNAALPLVVGQDTVGNEVVVDLTKMPHLLIAGSTGSGKSVGLNAFLVSMLCKLTPDELKLILIDPKRLEFASYADIPHLLFPIVVDPKRAAPVLRWVVEQMEERYVCMAEVGARNIADYNTYVEQYKQKQSDEEPREKLPFIVIVIDELSDLMMTAGRDIEDLIARIVQMARAAGIHMIVATQRPSVDVITGLIKVNFPSRISFRVSSKIDSRTILDCSGAEKLLGYGDMLFLDSRTSTLERLHGAYVSNQEIERLVAHIRAQRAVEYLPLAPEFMNTTNDASGVDDALVRDVLAFLDTTEEVSISLLQRKFRIGYNRSARIIDMLEARGVIMPADGSKARKVIR
jgi:DNA segregation ATPase FtsK/SpoIIIE, S-DNA-T family